MLYRDDQLIQTASGLLIPKQIRKRQAHQCEVQQDPEAVRDWPAYWESQGQPWRREPEIDQERQQLLQQRLKIKPGKVQHVYPFQEIVLKRNDLEWLIQKHKENSVGDEEHPQELNLQQAILGDIDCTELPLKGANFGSAKLEGANFESAKLKGANFWDAELEGANFGSAKLEGAHFGFAWLGGAHFGFAELEGANFECAGLEGADFRSARIADASFLSAVMLTAQGIGPMVADVTGWDERSLPIHEWSAVKRLGDEAEAKTRRDSQGKVKDAATRFREYFAATRAYRQVATAVEDMGRKEEAETFAFRAQVMQRKMHWWSIWQRDRTFWQRLGDLRAWGFSGLLALLAGYGYRFARSFSWYLAVLLAFAWLYVHLSQNVPPHSSIPEHLSWLDACILSVSDMVGRGFFRQDVTLSDPYAGWSVLEGMIGVFMDIVLISTLTQRLFKK